MSNHPDPGSTRPPSADDQFRLLVDGVLDYAIFGLDVDGLVTTWNSGAERIKGYRAEEIIGRHFSVFYPPEASAAGVPDQELVEAAACGSVETEGWRIRRDGSSFWADVVITALYDDDGHLDGFAKVTRDVTERRAAEGAIRETEERARTLEAETRLAQIVESSDDYISSCSLDGLVTSWNSAAERMIGYTAEEMVGQNYLRARAKMVPAGRPDEVRGMLERVARGERGGQAEVQRIHKDGTVVDMLVSVSPIRDASGTLIGISNVGRDITERKRLDQVLALERRRLRAAESIGHIGSWEMDAATGETVWSETVLALYGMDAGDFDGRYASIAALIYPDDRDEVAAAIKAGMAGSETFRVRYRMIRADDGEVRWFDAYGERVFEEGQFVRLAGMVVDVTEVVTATSVMEEARDLALEASRQKSEFLATMSHEIRTPMNAVIGMTELLLDTRLDADQRELGETISSGGDALLAIINDILDFSKIEAGGVTLHPEPFDLRACVDDALGVVAGNAGSKGLELVGHVDERCPAGVVGDVTRLRQVLVNLLGNAVKFTAHGEIAFTVALVDPVGSDHIGGKVGLCFAVADTGIGIPSDRLAHLFEWFRQVDSSTTRAYGGSGLGLAISQRLVEAMGATIGVASVSGAGSTFHFTLSLPTAAIPSTAPAPPATLDGPSALGAPGPTVAPLGPAAPETTQWRRLRVLVAEDNPINQLVCRRLLNKLGHDVSMAGNGREALEAMRLGSYDAVLMDIQMPKMDGLEATRLIRSELPADRQPHIVAVTASVLVEDRHACADAGMDDYLPKPVRLDDLDVALRRAVAGHTL